MYTKVELGFFCRKIKWKALKNEYSPPTTRFFLTILLQWKLDFKTKSKPIYFNNYFTEYFCSKIVCCCSGYDIVIKKIDYLHEQTTVFVDMLALSSPIYFFNAIFQA